MIPPEDKGLAAITADGTLVGYCGFLGDSRGGEARISALQSRLPGAGSALLDALKARFYLLMAVDVLETAAAWWERRGFVLMYPATEDDEVGVIGTFEWWRDSDPVFAERNDEPMWPSQRCVARLIWDEQDRQHAARIH